MESEHIQESKICAPELGKKLTVVLKGKAKRFCAACGHMMDKKPYNIQRHCRLQHGGQDIGFLDEGE